MTQIHTHAFIYTCMRTCLVNFIMSFYVI